MVGDFARSYRPDGPIRDYSPRRSWRGEARALPGVVLTDPSPDPSPRASRAGSRGCTDLNIDQEGRCMWSLAAVALGLIGAASAAVQPPAESSQPAPAPKAPPPPYEFRIGTAQPSIQPFTHGSATVQEGKIDVTTENNTLKAVLTG